MGTSFPENANRPLNAEWQLARTSPAVVTSPEQLATQSLTWLPAPVPGTVAQVMFANVSAQADHIDLDAFDWWYQCEFSISEMSNDKLLLLCFDGLATFAQVWLNDKLILNSENMFLPRQIDIRPTVHSSIGQTAHQEAQAATDPIVNKLVICFRSLTHELDNKRPRPRWKTNLVSHQQLRWLRTSLLGRIPGWSPPVAPVGPWRAIRLKQCSAIELTSTRMSNISATGAVTAQFSLRVPSQNQTPGGADLIVDGESFPLEIARAGDEIHLTGEAIIPLEKYWWPHTHGEPVLLSCKLLVQIDDVSIELDLGARGFKHLQIDRTDNQLGLIINGEKIFCRGACWTIADIYALDGIETNLRRSLTLARDAGINMLRVGGTMIYESDIFYGLCDELGIVVWQDFMFANMDYPVDDDGFHQSILAEAQSQLIRLSDHICIGVYCGNSEVQQQSAMMGQAKALWSNNFFDVELKSLCADLHPGAIYFPSTPCEGALPFSIHDGLSHYYGVGAYKRPLNDAALAAVKFTAETLGFSHIPEPSNVDKLFDGALLATHNPKWKQRVPRDSAAGWDFEDVRDHYLAELFNEDAVTLRSHNPQRYLELSRVVTGEIIQRVFAIWRSAEHPCQGALIWFYKDLWPGAGWGIIDSDNQPKAVYYAVKRAAKNLGVFFVDRGLDGLALSVINETTKDREFNLEVRAFKAGHIETLCVTQKINLARRSNRSLALDEMLGYFADLNYSYRFGPKQHDLVVARLSDIATGEMFQEDFYFPVNYVTPQTRVDGVIIEIITDHVGANALKITSPHFLQSVRLELKSHVPEDNYFHLAPNQTRTIGLQTIGGAHASTESAAAQPVKGYLEALNLLEPVRIR